MCIKTNGKASVKTKNLSQIVSSNAPNSLCAFLFLAYHPSKLSVNAQIAININAKLIFLQITAGIIVSGATTPLINVKIFGICFLLTSLSLLFKSIKTCFIFLLVFN